MIASLAQFESSLIGERTRAGTARARAEGKHVGRPPVPAATVAAQEPRLSIYRIGKGVGISYEAMAMIRKRQVRNIGGGDIRAARAPFIASLFQVAI